MNPRLFVLVHSPLVGPDTWGPVAAQLDRQGRAGVLPVLRDDGSSPFWRQHVRAVVEHVATATAAGTPLTVVAHSGAGQLLGHVGGALAERGLPPAAYVLADAGLPTGGQSRLEQLSAEAPAVADELRALFRSGGRFPAWGEEQLRGLVPDPERRRRLLSGVRRQPLDYWREPVPPVAGWPDAPCAVLLFSEGYERTAQAAREQGWPVRDLGARNHFLPLADPDEVARELTALDALLAGEAAGRAG